MIDTLAQLVPEQARLRPNAPAVRCGDDEWSWAEFDDEVARTAGLLLRLGVGSGDRVGICLYKSMRTPLAVHAVLRAGAAYVPLDPQAPDPALAAVINDCGIEVVVTDQPAAARLDRLSPLVSGLRAVLGGSPDGPFASVGWDDRGEAVATVAIEPDDMAYVMYTSGSTGQPKGIMHTHRSALAYATRAAATYQLVPDDRLGFLTPIHFDMSTFELFAGPMVGACTVVVGEAHLRLPASLSQLIQDQHLTTLYGVPFLFTQLLDRGVLAERDLSRVRWLLYGGEPFAAARLAEWMHLLPDCRVSNVYGPAEVNQCTHHHLDAPPAADEVVPIGACWEGAAGRVVDEDRRSIPAGEAGELEISAPTMMSGYWGRPDLTAERVSLDDSGRRWYRTGDLVVEGDNGEYCFLGRLDDQVKVRGHRLELTPVELAVASVDGVRHAVAGVVPGAEGASELVAVFVGSAETDAVIKSVAGSLPPYAVPTRVQAVPDLPTGSTGKIDRRRVRTDLFPQLFPANLEAPAP
ncbi:MAG: amino acid adenylation domain-containing protein [Acidimicrobiales bacterium]